MCNKVILGLTVVLSLSSFALAAKAKRHAWYPMQNDGPAIAVVQPQQQFPAPLCEPPLMPAIGKRSLQPLDSFPNLSHFFLNEENSDVYLVVNGTKFAAHKFVMSAKSHKFAELFKSDPTKAEFDMGQVSEEVFKMMLKYFYTESFQMEPESEANIQKAIDVFNLANEYEVEGLKAQVERSLAKLIQLDNYIDILKFAEANQMYELVKLWMTFVFTSTQQIVSDERFVNESNGVIIKVLSALNAPGGYVISRIKKMMEEDPSINIEDLRSVVHLERCSFDDLATLGQMGLFDYHTLFDDVVKRYRALSANCQRPLTSLNRRGVPLPGVRWVANNRPEAAM